MGAPSVIINDSYKLIWGGSLETLEFFFLQNLEYLYEHKQDGGEAFQGTPGPQMGAPTSAAQVLCNDFIRSTG